MLRRWRRSRSPEELAEREEKEREKERVRVAEQLRAAGITDRRLGGGGGLLTEPVLAFRGPARRDLKVFDQDAHQVGIAHNLGVSGAELRDMAGNCLLVIGRENNLGFAFVLREADGKNLARIGNPSWRGSHTVRRVTAGTEALGALKIRLGLGLGLITASNRASVEDATGCEVAKLFRHADGQYVVDMTPSTTGPLRTVAVAGCVVCDIATWGRGSGG